MLLFLGYRIHASALNNKSSLIRHCRCLNYGAWQRHLPSCHFFKERKEKKRMLQLMISVAVELGLALSWTRLIQFFPSRPFPLVLSILYQRDKHLKRVTEPARSSTPASCTTSRLWPARSCSSTRRSSPQVRALTLHVCPVSFRSCAFFSYL